MKPFWKIGAAGMIGLASLGGIWVYGHDGDNSSGGGTGGYYPPVSPGGGTGGGTGGGGSTPLPSLTPRPVITPIPTSSASPTPSASPQVSPSPSITVEIPAGATGLGPAAYGTNPLVVQPNTTVTWINNDSLPHTVTSNDGLFDSGTMQPGESFSFTFNDPGTFGYFCAIHGAASMSGSVEVQQTGAASPGPSATPSASPSASPSVSPSAVASVTPSTTPAGSGT